MLVRLCNDKYVSNLNQSMDMIKMRKITRMHFTVYTGPSVQSGVGGVGQYGASSSLPPPMLRLESHQHNGRL